MLRGIKKLASALLCAALLLTGLSGCRAAPKRYEAQFLDVFDTVTTIVCYTNDKEAFTEESRKIYEELKAYHQLYDIYNDYPGVVNVKAINDAAGKSPVKVEEPIISLLLLAKKMSAETNGGVNVAMGSVLSIWHDYRERGIDNPENAELPPMDQLKGAAAHTDINEMVLDEKAGTAFLQDASMSLDVGAIAKGYAAQRVCDSARARGVESLLLSVGGNVCAIGNGRDGKPWNVGVQKPDAENGESLLTVCLADEALVTSGDYQRYYTVEGERYHHIIDPKTLMPARYCTAVTVICPDSGMADAFSTALYNMSVEDGKAFLRTRENTEAVWLMPDGGREYSDEFEAYIKK